MDNKQNLNEKQQSENQKPVEKFTLPPNYDVVTEYQENIEQGIVDSLFDYFGKVYYQSDVSTQGKKVRNNYISKYDARILRMFARRTNILWFIFAILFILGVGGLLGILFGIGFQLTSIHQATRDWPGGDNPILWTVVFAILIGISCGLIILSIVLFISVIYWMRLDARFARRTREKIKEWNRVFDRFSRSLDKASILNAIQSGIPDFVLDRRTPAYDRKIYNIHNRIYAYSGIPQDARRVHYTNTLSGFYKGYAFSLSISTWEWFREAKLVEEEMNKNNSSLNISVKRSLKRFEDSICLLVVDTFADPKLNFVLNNPEGKNIRLQNDIFNNIFSLAVNNAKHAHNVFTPYVQHSLSRLKTWTNVCKNVRQVIKEGSKIYIVFDADADFFKFDRIVNPSLNYVFNSKNISENTIYKNGEMVAKKGGKNKYKIKCGSLDETASLMTEYILEETDLLYTALEMATCFPADDVFKKQSKKNASRAKTLMSILEEKRQKDYSDEAANALNLTTTDDINLVESEFNVPNWNADKAPDFKPLVNVDID